MSIRPFFVLLFVAATLVSCINNDVKAGDKTANAEAEKAMSDSANFTTIQWIDSVKNYGKIQEGPKLDILYRFKNTGNKPLIIAAVKPGCGCTVADKPTKPIMPGEEGEIKAQFESKGHPGMNNKSITVQANTKPIQSFELRFSVDVEKKG
ncbi:MAG: DUF1573 domain-containing protein [Bacteroidota bacterium]